jgi:hypothetical protein
VQELVMELSTVMVVVVFGQTVVFPVVEQAKIVV